MEESTHHEESLKKVSGLYKDWFLDYASYVILDRAIPSIYDGFQASSEKNHAFYAGVGRRAL